MLKIGIIVGSTRPGRKAKVVAEWVHALASRRGDAAYEIIDIETFALPLLDEPLPPAMGNYAHEHTRRWAAHIAQFDAFVFVTPEYNHSIPAALKNAMDFIYAEWNNKAAGVVSYGGADGARGVEHLRGVMGELQIACVHKSVLFSMYDDFENFTTFKPRERFAAHLADMLDQVVGWGGALRAYRESLAKA